MCQWFYLILDRNNQHNDNSDRTQANMSKTIAIIDRPRTRDALTLFLYAPLPGYALVCFDQDEASGRVYGGDLPQFGRTTHVLEDADRTRRLLKTCLSTLGKLSPSAFKKDRGVSAKEDREYCWWEPLCFEIV